MKKIRSIRSRLIMAILLLCSLQLSATQSGASPRAVSLITVINELESRLDVRFNYNTELLKGKQVTIPDIREFRARNIETRLNKYISPLGLVCRKIAGRLYVVKAGQPDTHKSILDIIEEAQREPVKGVVKDSAGNALPGVSVHIKGSSRGTTTDMNGQFRLDPVNNGDVLVFSLLGYTSVEQAFTGQQTIDIVLRESAIALDQFVVTALGIRRQEKALGYAVQKVKGDAVQTVKGVDVATSLTGQAAGLVIKNSTEFFARPTIELRGEGALLVIDGVPYGNTSLRDLPTDDIESIDILKGPTASALYGSRAAGGVILVTTKKGSGGGLSISINSNTMLQTGFLAIPKIQSSYARGQNGEIDNDYVWGPKLDIGETARDWNPVTKQFEDDRPLNSLGKNNLKNFMETGLITNNNISVAQSGQYGSFRASLNHIYNKGQFPNAKLNMFNFTVGGELKATNKFTLESHVGISRRTAPQIWGSGYGNQGYIYQLTMWTGPEYDIRQYRDYWKVPYQTQNWMYTNWYDNPYLIAYEKLNGIQQSTINASLTANYKFTPELSLLLRIGYDVYDNKETFSNPTANIYSTRGGWNARGLYRIDKDYGWSTNDDIMLNYQKKAGDFTFDVMAGGTIYRWVDETLSASTKNGLTSPTFYSLAGSVEPPTISPGYQSRQVNSLYGRAAIGWKNAVFIDATGRNDWNSSQPEENRAYFYPSIGSSVVLSEFLMLPGFVDMWKVRGSWATFKTPADVYAINRLYSTSTAAWNTLNSASYPSNLLGASLLPSSQRTWEIGTAAYLFQKRVNLDVAYFNKYYYNRQIPASISNASGFSSTLVNTDETYVRKGIEITLGGSVIRNSRFEWISTINFSNQHRYYKDLDSVYSAKSPWVKKGERLDNYTDYYWLRDPQGNVIHNNGYPMESDYVKKYGYTDPDFSFGFINTFLFGNFTMGLNIDGRIGGLMYNYVNDKMFDTGTHPDTDNNWRYDEVVNGKTNYVGNGVKVTSGSVTYDNFGNITSDSRKYATNDVQVSYQDYTQNFRAGDYGVQKKSFVKIREMSLGYRVPSSVLGKSGIKSASVSVTAQNLFLFTKFRFSDPDVDDENLNAPSQRMVGINFRVGF
ncbi:SusC/RagA family TonB-linked outer membrane protein [Chitinophaga cymbidii]|uniref:SusC/RagA family TonB-linked outer membrane protein n=1 Tax=Chitinophaga cymbidii TaxID=1096750 RepID=A0A512RP29_9BACT|nr:SusC/RagA family TonB-linked outer membrane protein [Chitinophaga cymbidii]GEP97452.1 SusC/RagA family TonB-linked outer membrane protein [Chitinophaga cymbidii]